MPLQAPDCVRSTTSRLDTEILSARYKRSCPSLPCRTATCLKRPWSSPIPVAGDALLVLRLGTLQNLTKFAPLELRRGSQASIILAGGVEVSASVEGRHLHRRGIAARHKPRVGVNGAQAKAGRRSTYGEPWRIVSRERRRSCVSLLFENLSKKDRLAPAVYLFSSGCPEW